MVGAIDSRATTTPLKQELSSCEWRSRDRHEGVQCHRDQPAHGL